MSGDVRDGRSGFDPDMRSVFGGGLFAPRDDQAPSGQHRRTYQQLRHITHSLDLPRSSRQDPRFLFAALEWAAVVNPALFLTGTVHYGVCVSGIDGMALPDSDLSDLRGELDAARTVGTILITEVGHGTSHVALRTRADYHPETGCFELSTPDETACKFMAHAGLEGVPKVGMVYAQLRVGGELHGVFPFLVRLRDEHRTGEGVRIGRAVRSDAVDLDYTLVRFDGTAVPYEQWLSDGARIDHEGVVHDPADSPRQRLVRSLRVSRNASTAGAVGLAAVARATGALTTRYVHHRTTSGALAPGATLAGHARVRRILFPALAAAMAATAQVNRALRITLDGGDPQHAAGADWSPWASVHSELALTKVIATWTAERVTGDCRKLLGAHGVLNANRIHAYEGLAAIYHSAGGDNTLTTMDLARALAGDPRAVPVPSRLGRTDEADTLVVLARVRENLLRTRLCARLGADRCLPEADRWDRHAQLADELVGAHAHRIVLEQFLAWADSFPPGQRRDALHRLCLLNGLDHARRHGEELYRAGWLSHERQQLMDTVFTEQCDVLAEYGAGLVETLGITTDGTGAPLAADDHVAAMTSLAGIGE
ncbi:Acyl-coenzyme A oxidase [Actinopolyspora lacussalsi subsp. righensis]|uniref:Acyl-coenzyme A oxidase n=1 Tax=Actinopolyspora righensis TaxID=995060 RepID=A0A1I6XC42_9ACTN|nr:acyl-CoA dehydrogenase [Actinopolyspora righensis]SFT35592.1 Acyl-coenzyme A oxidase [Actinopolyspora righensis]